MLSVMGRDALRCNDWVEDMGRLTYGAVARGVSREKLFEWYTDFSPEDVDIIKRRGDGRLLSRKVTREGNKLHIESEMRGMGGKPMRIIDDAVVHPDDYSYDIHISIPGMLEADRHYTFTQVPEGAGISFEDDYRATGGLAKAFKALGLLKGFWAKGSRDQLQAFVAEAEDQIGRKERS